MNLLQALATIGATAVLSVSAANAAVFQIDFHEFDLGFVPEYVGQTPIHSNLNPEYFTAILNDQGAGPQLQFEESNTVSLIGIELNSSGGVSTSSYPGSLYPLNNQGVTWGGAIYEFNYVELRIFFAGVDVDEMSAMTSGQQKDFTVVVDWYSVYFDEFYYFLGYGDTAFGTATASVTVLESNVSAVPLPASLPLSLAGLAGLGLVARRRTA